LNLLLDVGNTRIKWALHDGRGFTARGAIRHRDVSALVWRAALPLQIRPSRVLAANVAGSVAAAELDAWARDTLSTNIEYVVSTREAGGLRNAYAIPSLLGVDRWLGMVGVRAHCHDPFLLAAAGTAFTIDLVDSSGEHQGGVIVPGRSLMIDTLKDRTGNIATAAAAAEAICQGMFGLNTAGAIECGATHALVGLLDRAIDAAYVRCGRLRLFGYGGDPGDVFQLTELTSDKRIVAGLQTADDAVLAGLAVLAADGSLQSCG
jgi:type III pantothenate kinase